MTQLTGYDAVPGIGSPGVISPGSLGLSESVIIPFPYYFSAVPGLAVPGRFTIAFPQGNPGFYYLFIGHYALWYLDYIDINTAHTLIAHPSQIYATVVASGRYWLHVTPPPDGRWGIPGPPSWDEVIRLLPGWTEIQPLTVPHEIHLLHLRIAKAHNAHLQAAVAGIPAEYAPHGIPAVRAVPPEPQLALAAGRRANADLQARRAREG